MKVFERRMEWLRLAAQTGLLTLASAVLSLPASAAAGGQALPWEAPLTRLQQSLCGPVAGAIAIIALVAIGVTLVFGGEWKFPRVRRVAVDCCVCGAVHRLRGVGRNENPCPISPYRRGHDTLSRLGTNCARNRYFS